MRVIIFRKNQKVKVEKTKNVPFIWEDIDGFHPAPVEAVYKHRMNKLEPVIIYFEDLLCPYGTKQDIEKVNKLMMDIDVAKKEGATVPISWRIGRLFSAILPYLGIIIIVTLVAYAYLSNQGG